MIIKELEKLIDKLVKLCKKENINIKLEISDIRNHLYVVSKEKNNFNRGNI